MSKLSKSALLFCIVLVGCGGSFAQIRSQKKSQDAFASIPIIARAQLFERLKLFIRFQSANNWAEMYDFSADPLEHKDLSREEFIKNYSKVVTNSGASTLVEFAPKAATFINEYDSSKEWLIEGCAKYRDKKRIFYIRSGLSAILHNKTWYFTYLSSIAQVDGPEEACSNRKQKE